MQVLGDAIPVLEDGHPLGLPAVLGQFERYGRLGGERGEHLGGGLGELSRPLPPPGRQHTAHLSWSAERYHDHRPEVQAMGGPRQLG